MAVNTKPSIDPANEGSLPGTLRHFFEKQLQGVDDMLPCQVLAFDGNRDAPRVRVQIMYMVTRTDNTVQKMHALASIPVLSLSGGGFLLSFPIKVGDLGWIKANDQDLSLFLQSYQAQPGNTKRMHSFEDGVFIPDVMRGYSINPEDLDNVVLQTLDGTQRVTVWPDRVKVTASLVEVVSAGDVIFSAAGNITLEAGGTVSLVSGGQTAISSSLLTHNGKDVGATHKHAGVTSGPSQTGVPV